MTGTFPPGSPGDGRHDGTSSHRRVPLQPGVSEYGTRSLTEALGTTRFLVDVTRLAGNGVAIPRWDTRTLLLVQEGALDVDWRDGSTLSLAGGGMAWIWPGQALTLRAGPLDTVFSTFSDPAA